MKKKESIFTEITENLTELKEMSYSDILVLILVIIVLVIIFLSPLIIDKFICHGDKFCLSSTGL